MPLFPAEISLADIDGTNGFVLQGQYTNSETGWWVSSAGDVNGDGIDDFIVGAPLARNGDISHTGAGYIVLGSLAGFPATLSVAALDGSNGYTIESSQPDEKIGVAVSGGGDVNGDGIADTIVASALTDVGGVKNVGGAYVIFGSETAHAQIDVSTLDGTNGFVLHGTEKNDGESISASDGGDLNGDGYDDVLVGFANYHRATENGSTGLVCVVFGKADGFPAVIDTDSLNGNNGFEIVGHQLGSNAGFSVGNAGDVNGDGTSDIILTGDNGAYVIFGSTSGFAPVLDLSTINGTNGFMLSNSEGFSAKSAGDINGDGFADIIVGDPDAQPKGLSGEGAAYVVFGKAGGFPATLDSSALNGTNGFVIEGASAGDLAGWSVSSAGDVNGDGFSDILVSASDASPGGMTGAGSEFVIFGHAGGFSASIDLATLDGTNGFRIDGSSPYEQAGQISSSAGDINDDGFSDILIGAPTLPNNDPDDHNGQAFVLYGRAPLAAVSLTGTDAGQTLAGGAFDDDLRGRHGADSLYGNGGNDTLYGGDGNDVLKGGAGNDALRGNAGSDTAAYDQATGSVHVDLSVSRAQHVGGGQGIDTLVSIENLSGSNFSDRLTGNAGANTLTGLHGNDHLTGGLGADTLNGGAGRDVYVYNGAADSTGHAYDTILGLNTNHDFIDLAQTVAGVDVSVSSGHLDAAHINAGLVTAIGAAQLGAFDAVLFTPDSGTLAGKTFLIVDANGTAGYQADADYVIQLDGAAHLDGLSAANFI